LRGNLPIPGRSSKNKRFDLAEPVRAKERAIESDGQDCCVLLEVLVWVTWHLRLLIVVR